jgi:hypothetical protein
VPQQTVEICFIENMRGRRHARDRVINGIGRAGDGSGMALSISASQRAKNLKAWINHIRFVSLVQ